MGNTEQAGRPDQSQAGGTLGQGPALTARSWREKGLLLLALCFLLAPLHSAEVGLEPGLTNPSYHEPPSWFKESFAARHGERSEGG